MMVELADFHSRPPLTHLKRLTTKDGLVQHADLEVPDPAFGYSIDDNARGLIAMLRYYGVYNDQSVLKLAEIYFNYIKKVEKEGGTFHNFLSFSEKILDSEGSEDSIGRAIWALGETIEKTTDEPMRQEAKRLLKGANIRRHLEHPHVRTKAYILLGLLSAGEAAAAKDWADRLLEIFNQARTDQWRWFEDSLRYANGIIPYALGRAYAELGDKKYLVVARESFDWLNAISRHKGKPAPIGQEGWYFKDGVKSEYDQQPLEAADMVLAATELYRATTESSYLEAALEWFDWYCGNNVKNQPLINPSTGGVYDALTPAGVNKNQGAESIVTYLLAYLALAKIAENPVE